MAATDWIKVRTVLPTDGRLRIASRKCHALPVTVFGAIVTLWCLADSHANENGELIGYTIEDIDAYVGVPGFCAALPSDWIDTSGDFVKLPDYQEHNGTTAKTRAQDSKRQKRHREVTVASRSDRDKKRTREEKRREDIKAPIVPSVDSEQSVLTAYHAALPKCRQIAVLNPKRKRRIADAVKLARQVCAEQGWAYAPAEFWGAYFAECAADPWLCGDRPNPNNPNWRQNLDVLLAEDRFAEIMDKAIASMAAAA